MAKDAQKKPLAEVQRAQAKFERTQVDGEKAREARRKSFERAQAAGFSMREIAKAAGLHFTRVAQILRDE